MPTQLEISVIVPTYNRALSLLETLKALSFQTLDSRLYEVIIVDDGSTDNTSDIVKQFQSENPSTQLLYMRHERNRFKSAALNTGLHLASGALIALTDDDICPIPTWLEMHLERHKAESRPVAVIGLVLYPEAWERKSNWVRFANENYRRMDRGSNVESGTLPPLRIAGGNMSISRRDLIAAGSFNEALRRGVDSDLACRLHLMGLPSVFERKAVVYHHADAIHSIDRTLQVFHRYYEADRQEINRKYPWALQRYGHWFLEPVNSEYDNLWRLMVKKVVRSISARSLQQVGIFMLKKTDGLPWLYSRSLHQYVHVCEALDAVKMSGGREA